MEDQLISGSGDCTQKFWKLKNRSWTCQQTVGTNYKVRNISFNETEDKLIVCENNCNSLLRKSNIQILIQNNIKQWSIVQTLDFDGWGWRLSFTIGDQFVFTTENSDLLEIYDYENNKQQYKKVAQLQIQKVKDCCAFFPCQYIASLNILTFKHGEYLNIIKVNENYKYELMQAIQFRTYLIYGRMQDDGQYFAIWNWSSKKIQIRTMYSLE